MAEITCPTDCTSLLPAVVFSDCAPKIYFGEISRLYVAKADADDFTDWSDDEEWAPRLDDTVTTTGNEIRTLIVMGDKPAKEKDEVVGSDGRTYSSPSTFTLNIEIDDISDTNYEFARTLECNGQYKVWFGNKDLLFGGNKGLLATINLDYLIEKGQKTMHKLGGTVKWTGTHSPERIAKPFTD